MSKRVDRHGMLGPYGLRYSWVYWAASAAALAFLIVDLFDDSAIWNIAVVVFVIIGIAVRPYGLRGPRAAAADAERAPSAGAAADEPAPSAGAAADEPAPRPT